MRWRILGEILRGLARTLVGVFFVLFLFLALEFLNVFFFFIWVNLKKGESLKTQMVFQINRICTRTLVNVVVRRRLQSKRWRCHQFPTSLTSLPWLLTSTGNVPTHNCCKLDIYPLFFFFWTVLLEMVVM